MNTIPEAFFEAAGKFSHKTALLYKKEGVYFPISYQELSDKITVFSAKLQELGIKKGDNVAILSENRPEWVVSDLAAMHAGAVVLPIHTTFSPEVIFNILEHAQVKIIIVSNSDLLSRVLINAPKLTSLNYIIFFDNMVQVQKKSLGASVIFYQKIFLEPPPKAPEKIVSQEYDCASIIYTSGTTGQPKGVMLSHKNFLSNIRAINEAIPVKQSDIFLSFLPLSHVLERTGGYYLPLFFGATIAYAEGIKQLSKNLREVSPTALIAVPRVFEKFQDAIWDKVNTSSAIKKNIFKWSLKQKKGSFFYTIANVLVFKKIRRQFGGNLRLAICGGASLNESICRFFSKIGILILEGYGLTETSPVITVNSEHAFKFGSVGKAISGVEIAVSEYKEVLVRGPNVFLGYFNKEKESKDSFDKDGWFFTGDLGFIDAKGFLTIIGRKKEMILLSGGKNVWPESIENVINNDKYISQSMVVGDKQKFVSALIVPDWQELTIYCKKNNLPLAQHDELVNHPQILALFKERMDKKINSQLSDVDQIKKFSLLSGGFYQEKEELTPTLKLRRHIISQHYKREIEALYQ